MLYPLYILAGIIPSFVWLLWYLRKDSHPESNSMILRVFLFGMLVSLPVIVIEIGFFNLAAKIPFPRTIILLANIFIGIAFTEEVAKYLVVKYSVIPHPELDEPIDVVLYMIITALGFAASENILLLFRDHPLMLLPDVLSLVAIRFIGATFLHALCSGVIGFFAALSIFEIRRKHQFTITGIGISTILHGLYNFSIIAMKEYLRFVIPVIILITLASLVSLSFQKLKKLNSVCKVR